MSGAHDMPGGAIHHQGKWNAPLLEFPGGQTGTLQAGTGFIHIDKYIPTALMGCADHTQGSAMADGRQGTRVAMVKKYRVLRNQREGVLANPSIRIDFFCFDSFCFSQQDCIPFSGRKLVMSRCTGQHAIDCPAQVDGGGAG